MPSVKSTGIWSRATGRQLFLRERPRVRILAEGDAEHRERAELRSKANLTNYLDSPPPPVDYPVARSPNLPPPPVSVTDISRLSCGT